MAQDDSIMAASPAAPAPGTGPNPAETGDGQPFVLDLAGTKSNLPFAFTSEHLNRLINARHPAALTAYGGLQGLASGLHTNLFSGIGGADEEATNNDGASLEQPAEKATDSTLEATLDTRQTCFGVNRVPRRKPKPFHTLLWLAFNDKLIFLLTGAGVVSLALGIYHAVKDDPGNGPRLNWVEGVAILVAVIIIVLTTSLNDLRKNTVFQKLNQREAEHKVTVTRGGQNCSISVFDVVVGDVLHIEAGDIVCADGILISGSGILCDESSLTGESALVEKTSATNPHGDAFILSGTRVMGGVGRYMVIAVGPNSQHGRILMSLDDDVQETPLQQKLGLLATYIVKIGLVAGLLFFVVLFIRYLARLNTLGTPEQKGHEFLDLFILSIALVVIIVPEGLALTVLLALAFATTRMLKDNTLVRLLRSCEVLGNTTTVCCDKTGTLTLNDMRVVAGMLGTSTVFGEPPSTSNAGPTITREDLVKELSTSSATLLRSSIALNSTAVESATSGQFIGSGTETALLEFAHQSLSMGPLSRRRAASKVVRMVPFDAARKWMAVIVELNPGYYRMFIKGACEVVLDSCTESISEPTRGTESIPMTTNQREGLNGIMTTYAENLLRVVAMAYKDIDEKGLLSIGDDPHTLSDLTWIGMFGIRDPLRKNVSKSVRQCQAAGVFVRMVTGDNFITAKAMAAECGIYTPGGVAMDGPTFRKLTPAQLDAVVPRLQVLARSTPADKRRLVAHLRKLDEVVAVTGDGTNDAFALREADVGLSMGLSGTEVAKEASDIIIVDDNFASIVRAISWGRAINDAAKKFIQFEFTLNTTAGLLTIITTLVSGVQASVFSVVQLLWINLILDSFVALALSTDYPRRSSFHRKPQPRHAPLIDPCMWKMIVGQSIYQMAVTFTLFYAGPALWNVGDDAVAKRRVETLTFNSYVLMQFFNQTNCRSADGRYNILEGILRNPWFFVVQSVTIIGQVVIVLFGGDAFGTEPLTQAQWGWSVLFGVLTLPVGALIRTIPDAIVPFIWGIISAPFAFVRGVVGRSLRPLSRAATADIAREEISAEFCRSDPFDVNAAIDACKNDPASCPDGFELHPDTYKDDLVVSSEKRAPGVPPSQSQELARWIRIPTA